MNEKSFLKVTTVGLILALLFGFSAFGATLVVDGDGGCNDENPGNPYCTIQAAVDDASSGDTILVSEAGEYETVLIDETKNKLRLEAEDSANKPVIDADAGESDYGVKFGHWVDGEGYGIGPPNVSIAYFDVKGGHHGIALFGSDTTGSDNYGIYGNEVSNTTFIGIDLADSHGYEVFNNYVHDSEFAGVALWEANDNVIGSSEETANEIVGNYLFGIVLNSSSNNTIEHNLIADNVNPKPVTPTSGAKGPHENGRGIGLFDDTSDTLIEDNVIRDNGWAGIDIYQADSSTIVGNEIYGNVNQDVAEDIGNPEKVPPDWWGKGIQVGRSAGNWIVDNDIVNNGWAGINLDDSIPEGTGPDEFLDLHEMLDTYGGDWTGFLEKFEIGPNVVLSNYIANQYTGVNVSEGSYNLIADNTIESNSWEGIHLENTHSNYIFWNSIHNNDVGIILEEADENWVEDNAIESNDWAGIFVQYSEGNVFINNDILDNDVGIEVKKADENLLENNWIEDNYSSGIHVGASWDNRIINNDILYNEDGISIEDSEGTWVEGNQVYQNEENGINLYQSVGNDIIYNEVYENEQGIMLGSSKENLVKGNQVYSQEDEGIGLHGSKDNLIKGNYIYENDWVGIFLESSSHNKILDNEIYENSTGILLEAGDTPESGTTANHLVGNMVHDNRLGGIALTSGADDNNILDNEVYGNDLSGIFLDGASYNLIAGNKLINNGAAGVWMEDVEGEKSKGSDYNEIISNDIVNNSSGVEILGNNDYNNISRNVISGNNFGILFAHTSLAPGEDPPDPVPVPEGNELHFNSISGNGTGLFVIGTDPQIPTVEASLNWWGDPTGPQADFDFDGNFEHQGSGDSVKGDAIISPWLLTDPDANPSEPGVQLSDRLQFVVDDVGPEPDQGFIQAGVDGTRAGDVVHVLSGNYTESVYVDHSIELYGHPLEVVEGEFDYVGKRPVIDAEEDRSVINLDGDENNPIEEAVVSNFILQNGLDGIRGYYVHENLFTDNVIQNSGDDGIELFFSDNNEIRGNIVENPSDTGIRFKRSSGNEVFGNEISESGWGIHLDNSKANNLSGNVVYNNEEGIHLDNSEGNILEGNVVRDNTSGNGLGVHLYYSDSNKLLNNKIFGNGFWGLGLDRSEGNLIKGNRIYENSLVGVFLYDGSTGNENAPADPGSDDNRIIGNSIVNNDGWGLYLSDDSDNTLIIRNVFSGNSSSGDQVSGVTIDNSVGTMFHFNSVTGNDLGLDIRDNTMGKKPDIPTVEASLNWWGASDGPWFDKDYDGTAEYSGSGEKVLGDAYIAPWLSADPDANKSKPGVQLVSPLPIMVSKVGPKPTTDNGNKGYLNKAIWGANYVDVTGKVIVDHGTYPLTESITDGLTLLSECGSTCKATIDNEELDLGDEQEISIESGNVRVGKREDYDTRGFTVKEDIEVGKGVNATTVHLNWNNLYGEVKNDGDGVLDAQYNWWGDLDPPDDTKGKIDYHPYLPEEVCSFVDYMEKHELEDPQAAIAGRSIEDEGGSTQLTAHLIANFNVKPREADELFDEFGYPKVREAFENADGEYEAFLSSLGVSSI